LVDKIQGRPAWSPEKIEDVSPEILDRFFSNNSPYLSQMPRLSLPDTVLDHSVNSTAFALPSESKIVELIRLSCKDGPISLSGVLSDMETFIKEKLGTKEKLLDVVHRRCQVVDSQGTTIVAWKEQ
jgi:3-hydroxyisobutyryl-CoA hydrolase